MISKVAVLICCLLVGLCCFLDDCSGHSIPTSESYRVKGLEKYGAIDEMFAGLMPIELNERNNLGSLFFWLVKQRSTNTSHNNKQPKSLVIWLNGGPGCSSMVGMMWENGPFTLHFGDSQDQKYRLQKNPYSWNEVADVLFVEQPLRTGFAIAAQGSEIIRTEKQIGEDFRRFLISLVAIFPEYKDVPIYLTGESYAGFYIPWIASTIIHYQMKKNPADKLWYRDIESDHLNLQGAAIGNGVLDYLFQEPSYAEYAYSHGLIPLAAKKKFDAEWIECLDQLEKERKPLTRGSFDRCGMMTKVLEAAGQPNEYNTATFRGYDEIIKAGGPFDTFFQDAEIQSILHVRGFDLPGLNFLPEHYDKIHGIDEIKAAHPDQVYFEPPTGWAVCNDEINEAMNKDHPTSAVGVLQFLSDFSTKYQISKKVNNNVPHSIRILLYSGEFDLNCNTLGTLHTLEANSWRKRRWYEAERSLWKFNGDVAGEYFTFDNIFSFLIVRNSGHLLPMDLPQQALEMLTRFLGHQTFADQILPSESFYMDQLSMSRTKENNSRFIENIGRFLVACCTAVGFLFALVYYYRAQNKPSLNNMNGGYELVSSRSGGEEEEGLTSMGSSSPRSPPVAMNGNGDDNHYRNNPISQNNNGHSYQNMH